MMLISKDSIAQKTSVKVGIYDFTENTASEFYGFAPVIMWDQHIYGSSRIDIRVIPAFAYNRTIFNGRHHNLYMLPLLGTVLYNLPNPESKIKPAFGMGVSLLWKADNNPEYEKTHQSFTYGFHATGKLNFVLRGGRIFFLDMTFNLLAPPVTDEINMTGVILAAGISITKKERTDTDNQTVPTSFRPR